MFSEYWMGHLYTNPNCRIGRTRGTMSPNRKDRDEVFHEEETPIIEDQDCHSLLITSTFLYSSMKSVGRF